MNGPGGSSGGRRRCCFRGAMATFTAGTTWLMDDFISRAFNPNGGTLAQQNWKAIAGVAGDMVSVDKAPLAFQLWYKGTGTRANVMWATFALMCSVIALAIDGATWIVSVPPLAALALVIGLLGLLFSGMAIKVQTDPALESFAELDLGLSLFADGAAALKWSGAI